MHALRGTVDAIIAGVGTVLADDPQLTVRDLRDGTLAIRQPLRVVVDRAGRTPADARVRDGAAPTWIATAAEVGAGPDGRVDLPALLAALYGRGVRAVLLEGGPTLAGAFLAAGLVDRVVGYVAPKLLGAGPAALVDAGVTTIAEAIELDLTDVTQIGPDLRFTALPRARGRDLDVHRHRRRTGRGRPLDRAGGDSARRRRPRAARHSDARHGDSIAVNGVCLTVVDNVDGVFTADVMGETLRRSLARRAAAPATRSTWNAPPPLGTGSAGTWCRATSTGSARIIAREPAERVGGACGSRCRRTSPGTWWRRARSPSTGCR